MDVVLGGGSSYLEPAGRKDGENLVSSIKALGYDYVTTPAAMKASTSGKLWGMFALQAWPITWIVIQRSSLASPR